MREDLSVDCWVRLDRMITVFLQWTRRCLRILGCVSVNRIGHHKYRCQYENEYEDEFDNGPGSEIHLCVRRRTWVHLRGLDWKVLGESCKVEGLEDRSLARGSCSGPCKVVKILMRMRVVMIMMTRAVRVDSGDQHMVRP